MPLSRSHTMRSAVALAAAAVCANAQTPPPFVGGYVFLSSSAYSGDVWKKLEVLAANAKTIPLTRLFLSFVDPQMVYVPGSNTLEYVNLNLPSPDPDFGFARLKNYTDQIRAGGVEVFLSMGGWDYGCGTYLFMQYSIANVQNSPNQWKINKYGDGTAASCTDLNQYCYVCEDPDQNEQLTNFRIWPEVYHSATWQAATSYVNASANATYPPVWSTGMVPGHPFVDPNTGVNFIIPGSDYYIRQNRDPYADFVYLAKDLGIDGIDLDYEEFWHADYYRYGPRPYVLPNTVYKFTAISYDVMLNIKAIYPTLKLSHAAGATGAWAGPFWGGNMKGLILLQSMWYPEVTSFYTTGTNAGGYNVMTYDLSDDESQYQCPDSNTCTLDQQVAFFMQAYENASIPASIGYEIGIPAFPDPEGPDAQYATPLNTTALGAIINNTQPKHMTGGFMWEIFKDNGEPDYATPTQTAQAICNVVLPGNARCNGTIPPLDNSTHFVGGYVFVSGNNQGWEKLEALAASATTVPVNRIWIAFFDPQMVYTPGSMTLETTGLAINNTVGGDWGFARLKTLIQAIRAGGVEVFISVGGWDFGCFSYVFMLYSIALTQNSPNFWKIDKYGAGDPANCNATNQYCYVCEDPDQNETLSNFRIWPEPDYSPTWKAAQAYVNASANATYPVTWHPEIIPGRVWVDPKNSISVAVPGTDLFYNMTRDPYQDMVYLAKDLDVDGIDLDWEEFWHSDYFREGPRPYVNWQTVYKFTAIVADVMANIQAIAPAMKLSHAAGATAAWDGPFWGGNTKGVILNMYRNYPETIQFMTTSANNGGINIMSYDLSDEEDEYQCPMPNVCTLDQQVQFFMATYKAAGIPASVGYEIGIPAFPDPEGPHAQFTVPLNQTALGMIINQTQIFHNGGFMWELFKPSSGFATPNETAQAICNIVLPGSPRCAGFLPYVNATL